MLEPDSLELEVKQMIIHSLSLEDVTEDDIDSEGPLFNEGLGLDSIDALELGIALHKTYGIEMDSESEDNKAYFASVLSLVELIREKRTK